MFRAPTSPSIAMGADLGSDPPSATAGNADSLATTRSERVAELFRAHNSALIDFLRTKLGSSAEAQDVAQEAYVRLLHLENPEQIGFLRAYLFQIAANLAVDRWRRRSTRDPALVQDLFEEWLDTPEPEQQAMAADRVRIVREALRELPLKTSRAFVMHTIQGMDYSVIAKHMKLRERMVRYHVERAMVHCRARVDEKESEHE